MKKCNADWNLTNSHAFSVDCSADQILKNMYENAGQKVGQFSRPKKTEGNLGKYNKINWLKNWSKNWPMQGWLNSMCVFSIFFAILADMISIYVEACSTGQFLLSFSWPWCLEGFFWPGYRQYYWLVFGRVIGHFLASNGSPETIHRFETLPTHPDVEYFVFTFASHWGL